MQIGLQQSDLETNYGEQCERTAVRSLAGRCLVQSQPV
jgi:hypothetical protein